MVEHIGTLKAIVAAMHTGQGCVSGDPLNVRMIYQALTAFGINPVLLHTTRPQVCLARRATSTWLVLLSGLPSADPRQLYTASTRRRFSLRYWTAFYTIPRAGGV